MESRTLVLHKNQDGNFFLQVPKADAKQLGIEHLISASSFENNTSVYLEFTVDTTLYMLAAYANRWHLDMSLRIHDEHAPLQNYKPYNANPKLTRAMQQEFINANKGIGTHRRDCVYQHPRELVEV